MRGKNLLEESDRNHAFLAVGGGLFECENAVDHLAPHRTDTSIRRIEEILGGGEVVIGRRVLLEG